MCTYLGSTMNIFRFFVTLLCCFKLSYSWEPVPDKETLERILDEAERTRPNMGRPCSNLAPGLDRMRAGRDAGYLDTMPFDTGIREGTRRPVFDFTCNRGQVWRSPYDNVLYDQPDQLSSVASLPRGILTYDSYLWKSFDEFRATSASQVGLDIPGIFGFSTRHNRLGHDIQANQRYIEEVGSFESATRADMRDPWELELNPSVNTYIQRYLPDSYEANTQAYDTFIDYFGTHYFEHAEFGGLMKITFSTSKNFVFSKGENSAKTNAEATFKNWLGFVGAHGNGQSRVDAEFTRSTTETRMFYGGSGDLSSRGSFSRWRQTVPRNPWLFAGELKPLTILMRQRYASKVAAMEKAVTYAMNRAALNLMTNRLNSYIEDINDIRSSGNPNPRCGGTTQPNYCSVTIIEPRLGVGIGCTVTGCEWSNLRSVQNTRIQEANNHKTTVDAEKRKQGRDTRAVRTLNTRTSQILTHMDTRARYESKRIDFTTRVCRCDVNECKCIAQQLFSLTAPSSFFSRWPRRASGPYLAETRQQLMRK